MTDKKKAPKKSAPKKKAADEPAIKTVRGGSICNPDDKGAHLIRGSNAPAVCRNTPGPDPRPRWRRAGK